jgi:hypothetical protein
LALVVSNKQCLRRFRDRSVIFSSILLRFLSALVYSRLARRRTGKQAYDRYYLRTQIRTTWERRFPHFVGVKRTESFRGSGRCTLKMLLRSSVQAWREGRCVRGEGYMDQKTGSETYGEGTAQQLQPPPAEATAEAEVRQTGTGVATVASEIARTAQGHVASLVADVKERVALAAEDRKGEVAHAIDNVAKAVHETAGKLEGQDWLAQMIERGAGELGTLATTLRSNDLQGLLGKLDELARRHPAVFVGAAMAVGFGAARVAKSVVAGTSEADLPELPAVHDGAN